MSDEARMLAIVEMGREAERRLRQGKPSPSESVRLWKGLSPEFTSSQMGTSVDRHIARLDRLLMGVEENRAVTDKMVATLRRTPPLRIGPPLPPAHHRFGPNAFWTWRDHVAAAIRTGHLDPQPWAMAGHARQFYNTGEAEAAEWTEKFLGMLQRDLDRRTAGRAAP